MMSPILLSAALSAGCGAGVEIRSVSDRTFDVQAKNASVATVLECLSERAGFKLSVDPGAAIRQLLTIRLDGRTAAQSVDRILEGLSVNYALAQDPDGGRLLMLMITGRSGAATSLSASSTTGTSSRLPDATTAPRRLTPFRPPAEDVEPEPLDPEPMGQNQGEGALQHPFVPPMPSPLYPEPQPLSPLSLRGAKRVPAVAEHFAAPQSRYSR